MKTSITACLIALIVGGAIIAGTVHFGSAQIAATPVNGIIVADTTWTKASRPYNLTGSVTVNRGATLTIEAGVIVNLNMFYLQINGTLDARGTSSNPINFNGGAPIHAGTETMISPDSSRQIIFSPSSKSWNQQTQSGSIIENALVSELVINGGSPRISNNSLLNIDVFGGSPEISNNNIIGGVGVYAGSALIANNTVSQQTHYFLGVIAQRYDRNNNIIIIAHDANPVVSNNVIIGDISQAGQGIGFETKNATIINNIIYGCYGAGIGFYEQTGNAEISNNIIYDCSYGISINDTGIIYGEHNATVTIQRNDIFNNTWGIDLTMSSTIQNNTIENNAIGIATSTPLTIVYNNIQSNNQSVYLTSPNDLNAANNWWGTTDETLISQSIYDSKNNNSIGTVKFVPFLNEPNAEANPNKAPTTLPTLAPSQTPSGTATPTPTPPQNSSTSPLPSSTQSETPSQVPSPPSGNGIGIYEILVAVLVVLVVAFTLVLVLILRERKR